MQSWIEEDATDDPAEQERREAEWQEFKDNLNAHRAAEQLGRAPTVSLLPRLIIPNPLV